VLRVFPYDFVCGLQSLETGGTGNQDVVSKFGCEQQVSQGQSNTDLMIGHMS
jgi:hypothetical protein